ncbi:4-diphosphocytidyl-2C-methyl-D-erythritol kinase [Mesorhizobium sp. Root157]|uniref:NTP transferase domain-containing protein n=1 Tax=Mesorhizobium sp. Root157 TaxID=1736477 RepID=UPI00070025FC|nr:molybdopterin-binding/glycosyltransferase family 2 protein [Mesorhizobium sp. Root157]KQZ78262.1 4-diphosphocytidyl-2C-methyl-D-erythritol kinase [Mesorhizobium sp. Root157]
MKFGPVRLDEAEGAILAHSAMVGEKRFRKARVLTAEDIAEMRAAGMAEVIVAVLDESDIEENDAATRITQALRFTGAEAKPAATGRVNIFAETDGVFTVDKALIDAANRVDPDVTIATLAEYAPVIAGQMVATVKIIPFAVSAAVIDEIVRLAKGKTAFAVNAFRPQTVGVVQTTLSTLKDSVLDKTIRVTEARLARSGSRVSEEKRTPHEPGAVAKAIGQLAETSDMVLVFGASAMSDPDDDVIPAAIRASGGTVFRSGMPVDPGNLFVLGERHGKPVLGAPGCARSPKPNGFDWVLDRLFAGIDVTGDDIAGMGVGGLLMEIPSRPEPREPVPVPLHPQVHVVLLAAGRSSRMGGPNKLVALFEGQPLVRRAAERVLASKASGAVVVTGHQSERVHAALAGLDLAIADNPHFAEGLSSSLKAGIARVPASAAGAMIVLGDMPGVSSADIDHLIDAFRKSGGKAVVRASYGGRRGNPVILPRSLFMAVAQLEGDTGARHLVESEGLDVIDIEIGPAAAVDVDTPEALAKAGGILQG